MASHYFDASALVKLYIEEQGTPEALRVAENPNSRIAILDISLLELRSAIRRREREGDLSAAEAGLILGQLEDHASLLYIVQPLTPPVIEEGSRLLDRHQLKAIDAIQLAGALVYRQSAPPPLIFACADLSLCEAASAEGLSVLNPQDAHGLSDG